MNVLIACEESQTVCMAFRKLGHTAFSCDIQPCSGGFPQYHIVGDVTPLLNGFCSFYTQNGEHFTISNKWDLIIAHPPCTYFSNATMVNLGRKDYPHIFNEEWKRNFLNKREKAFDFVLQIYNCNCEKICIENVSGYLSTHFMKPTQIIQPYYFGDPWKKTTCLWLKGLKPLIYDNVVEPLGKWVKHNLKNKNDLVGYSLKGVYNSKLRSKTFPNIARAMAEQWGD